MQNKQLKALQRIADEYTASRREWAEIPGHLVAHLKQFRALYRRQDFVTVEERLTAALLSAHRDDTASGEAQRERPRAVYLHLNSKAVR